MEYTCSYELNLLQVGHQLSIGPCALVNGSVDEPQFVDLEPLDGAGVDAIAGTTSARRKVDGIWTFSLQKAAFSYCAGFKKFR